MNFNRYLCKRQTALANSINYLYCARLYYLCKSMIIGFDAKRIVRNRTGLGSYGRNLINDLKNIVQEGTILNMYAPDCGHEDLRNQVITSENTRFVYPQRSSMRSIWRTYGIVNDLKRDNVDIFHGLSGELPLGIHKYGIKTVVTIHDLIFLRHPEYYKRIDVMIYAWKFRKTVKEADRIIAISECTKRDIMHYGNVPADKIDLIYQSCSTRFKKCEDNATLHNVKARYNLPQRYIVNVGTIEERKNIMLAVKAMQWIDEDISLVIVGRSTPYCDKVKEFVTKNNLGSRIRILHNVGNADLPSIYQLAEACVYPSRYEGFGIPIIEAIQSGLPVVACTGSCLEEAGGPHNIYVDPDDVRGMAEAIAKVLKGNDCREERIRLSQEYIKRFEGNNVAAQVLDIYNKINRH